MAKERLFDIDRAKGFAIFLVVVGHILSGYPPKGNDWFIFTNNMIYRFHMPFFMFLSGAILYYTFKPLQTQLDYFSYVKKKASRLLPGFFLLGVLILLGKQIFSLVMFVENTPKNLFNELLNILVNPYYSVAGSLWYVYVLFEYYMVLPLLLSAVKNKIWIVVLIGFLLRILGSYIQITHLFLVNLFVDYFIFLSLGFLFVQYYKKISLLFKDNFVLFFGMFILSFLSISVLPNKLNQLMIGIFSIPAIFSLVNQKIIIGLFDSLLLVLGEYTLSIYLMNTLFLGLIKGLLFKFLNWNGLNFLIFLPTLLIGGIILPILLQKYFLSKTQYLNKITK
jgi:fucose 4-O-acetylase-like acetyltransferase